MGWSCNVVVQGGHEICTYFYARASEFDPSCKVDGMLREIQVSLVFLEHVVIHNSLCRV